VTMLNYDMGREIFVNFGESVTRAAHQLRQSWSDFLNYYSNLNQERRRDEQRFAEERGLLEEHEDQMIDLDDEDDGEEDYDDYVPGVLIPESEYMPKEEAKINGEWLG
jgi:hypothetical protein